MDAKSSEEYFQKPNQVLTQRALSLLPQVERPQGTESSPGTHQKVYEILSRLARSNKQSVPGPSGLRCLDLCHTPVRGTLVGLFNQILKTQIIPSSWKTSTLSLICKRGDPDSPASWRPLALQECPSKTFNGSSSRPHPVCLANPISPPGVAESLQGRGRLCGLQHGNKYY